MVWFRSKLKPIGTTIPTATCEFIEYSSFFSVVRIRASFSMKTYKIGALYSTGGRQVLAYGTKDWSNGSDLFFSLIPQDFDCKDRKLLVHCWLFTTGNIKMKIICDIIFSIVCWSFDCGNSKGISVFIWILFFLVRSEKSHAQNILHFTHPHTHTYRVE